MTSLYPGTIFNTSGLNKKSTPSKPNITKDQLNTVFRRQSYNHGRAWPKESPVAGVYDVNNSSTSLIIINNRQRRASKLRGHNDPNREGDRIPNPDRHSRFGTPVTKEFHVNCHNSQSPYFSPTVSVDLDWANYTQRPPAKFYDGSPVNPKRHTSCRVPSDPIAFQSGMVSDLQRRPYSHISLPSRIKATPLLEHPELNEGEKQYLANIAKIYSANQMMKLKQDQYNKLLLNEMSKGLYNKDEIDQYRKFINIGRRRQYLSPPTVFRTASAPPPRTDYSYDEDSDDKMNSNATSRSTGSSLSDKSSSNNNNRQQGKRPKSILVTYRSKSPAMTSSRSKSPGMRSKSPGVRPKSQVSISKWQPQTSTQDKRKVGKVKNKDISDSSSETSSSEKNLPTDSTSLHKEGRDRPKSRLGHLSPKGRNKVKDTSESSGQETETSTPQKVPPPSPVNIPSAQNVSESEKIDQEPSDNTASSAPYRSSNSDENKDSNFSMDETSGAGSKSAKENETKNENSDKKDESPVSDIANEDSSRSHNKTDSMEDNIVSRSNEDSSKSDNKTDKKEGNTWSRPNEDSSKSDNKTDSKEDNIVSKSNEDSSRSENKMDSKEGNTLSRSNDNNDSSTSEDFTHSSLTKTYTTSFEEITTSQDKTDNSDNDNYTSSFPTYTGSSSAEKSTTQPSHSTEKYTSSTENLTSDTTTEYSKTEQQTTDDQLQRQDSLEEIDVDNPRHVNKDIDAIEY